MDTITAAFVIVVSIVAFLGGMRMGRTEVTPRSAYAPRLSEMDDQALRDLKPRDREAIREASAAIAIAAGRLLEIRGRLGEANSSYSSGVTYRSTPLTPVERSVEGAQHGLQVAKTILELPPRTPTEPPPDDEPSNP